jgi:UDP-N-acetylmuramyl pentapeptide phosphotransferase/UDP-N-acetylglucosamine-1-phosphate transferase
MICFSILVAAGRRSLSRMSNATTTALSIAGIAVAVGGWTVGSAVCVRRLAAWADRSGLHDPPNHRSSHGRPVPRIGGTVIVLMTALVAVAAAGVFPAGWPAVVAILCPALVVAVVSLADDVRGVPIVVRFAVHVGAAVAATALLGPLSSIELGGFGRLGLGGFAWPLTLLWIVGLTNAFNFMDGIDGIAGITAVVAAAAVAAASVMVGAPVVAVVAAGLATAAAGFLRSNWHPAAIFMGDVGSTFIGFFLAVLPLAAGGPSAATLVAVVAAAVWPFIFDTAFTFLRRLIRGENVLQAHRGHLYQRLVGTGLSHATVALLYGGLSFVGGMLALASMTLPDTRLAVDRLALAFALASAAGLVVGTLARESRGPVSPRASRGLPS